MATIGLPSDALSYPENRISYAAFGQLLERSAEVTGCSHFGLTAGQMWHLEDLGLISELMRHSATVGEALRTQAAYQHLNSGGGLTFLAERGAMAESGYAIYQSGVIGVDHIYDCLLAGRVNFLRELCGADWSPTQVFLPHAKPRNADVYRNLFKVRPQFDSEFCALRFPSYWLNRRIEGADPARKRVAQLQVDRLTRPVLLQQVHRAVRRLLLSGKTSGDDVADMLAMHRRTLNRRLKEQGTTFQEVLDHVRCEVARQLLFYTEVTLDDIAASLGYASVTPFIRSFHRWIGTTPAHWRRWGKAHRPGFGKVVAPATSAHLGSNAHCPTAEGVTPMRRRLRTPGDRTRESVAEHA
jgi:AraC-like DNA-binding protein